MSDTQSAPMKPQDTTIFLLGQLTEGIKALREGQAASQRQQAERDAKYEREQAERDAENKREHEEFRRTDLEHSKQLAVLNDNKQTSARAFDNRIQKWMVYLSGPTALVTTLGGLAWVVTHLK